MNARTVRDDVRERFPMHYQRICEIIHEQHRSNTHDGDWWLGHRSVSGGLCSLFLWSDTTEGHAYWRALHEGDEERCERLISIDFSANEARVVT